MNTNMLSETENRQLVKREKSFLYGFSTKNELRDNNLKPIP